MVKKFEINNGSPDDFQRQMQEFIRKHFKDANAFFLSPNAADYGAEEEYVEREDGGLFKFNYKPREIKEYLDRFVIKQDEAKKVISVALCDHYNHVRLALEGKEHPNYTKQNILLLGPTGVGKTYLIRCAAELIGVPFVKADATKFSETGYVGADVEDMVRELVRRANGDIKKAEYGIIYIDEIDKIASAREMVGRDVSGRGVQTNLLKLMEETEVPARSPQDIAGQIAALMDATRPKGKRQPATINTKHILFIVSGAFDGLEKIIRRRLRESNIGFAARTPTIPDDDSIFELAETRDFIEYGFEPEFIGRLPVRVVCRSLSVDDLFNILKYSEGSIIRQYQQDFAAYGINVEFADSGLKKIAELAASERTGARGLMTICERILRDFKFELPSTNVKQFTVDEALVNDPKAALLRLIEEQKQKDKLTGRDQATGFAEEFSKEHNLKITFTESAIQRLMRESESSGKSVSELCREKFKDYQFGLKLIVQNTGQDSFVIDENAVENPDKVLSDLVVESYRKPGDSQQANGVDPKKEQ
ncbi:MAG: AAA family ATPase [Verrucomicrobiia bacterium]